MAGRELPADVVWSLHVALVLFLAGGPWLPWRKAVEAHACLVPSILVHWLANREECGLTLLEARLRGRATTDTLLHRLIGPVYDSRHATAWSVAALAALWFAAVQSL